MKKFLFIILPSPSHYHASFSFARKLKTNGKEICYVGTQQLEEIVTNEGFGFMQWQYTTEFVIKTFNAFLGILLKSLTDKSFLYRRKAEFNQNIQNVRELVIDSSADEIYLDEHLAEYYIYIKDLNIKTKILCTKISSRKSKGIPPMNSFYIPTNSWGSQMYCELQWQLKNLKDQWEMFIHKIAFLGQDERRFLKDYCKKKSIALNSILDNKNYFYPNIIGLESIIIGQKQFDYPWKDKSPLESYEFHKIKRNEKKYITSSYLQFLNDWQRFEKEKKQLLYFSFGTVNFSDDKRIQTILNLVIEIVKKYESYILVISKSNFNKEDVEHTRIYTFPYVPQLDLLTKCDLIITHGGLNTINECIQLGVKMLVLPYMAKTDMPGNAIRVQYGGYGLMGKISQENQYSITRKIKKLLTIAADKTL